jgi:serine/threonine protein kinase
VSHKRSKVYRSVLQQETEYTDTFITSSWLTRGLESTAADEDGTHVKTAFTSLIAEDAVTDLSDSESAEAFDFDTSALEGRYVIRKEIHGGGMSRVFLADSAKLGNQWIVKFIPNHIGELANEENILKLLNHISLPKIIDIFRDEKGVYLVQSFIEGYSLNKVLETGQKINQTLILEWAEQLAQVLNYLHRLEPHPIYHYDLKPSNIMVTHDNRLVLIDFGISKRFGEDDTPIIGVTYKYAAPEQLKRSISDKHRPLIESRFGELPAERMTWNPDARTDIFSLGVILFELAVGQIPTVQNIKTLKDVVSHELCEIISKCLNIEPAGRYQSAGELLMDLQKNKGSKIKMARTLFMRKLASVSCAFTILASGGSLTGGYYIYGQENAALLGVAPEFVTVSLQQSSELIIEKLMPSGNIVLLDNSRVRWSFSHDNIAQIDGNRISGMNLGETVFSGRYRNKEITLNVRVVEPLDGMVDISQHYRPGHIVKLFAGTTERDFIDGTLADAEFVSPESIAVADDGTIYISDSGYLRRIRGNQVDSINIDPFYMMPRIVRCFMNEVFILTHEWEDDDGYYYGITRLNNNTAEALYMTNAMFTAIEDFTFSVNGLIHFIERNAGIGATFLKTLDPNDTDDIYTLCELPDGTSSLTIDERGVIYLANPETGVIQIWRDGTLSYFAGVENERAFIDGAAPLFYMPQVVKYSDGYLYVWDFNVLRRISIEGGVAAESITLAGEASPTFDLDIAQARQAAEDIILPNSRLTDFVILENGVLLTDPKRGVIWRAEN